MKIHQILPNFSYGDAIGDDTLALKRIFRALGHESEIFAGVIHPYLVDEAYHWKYHRRHSAKDHLLVYHFSVGSEIAEYLLDIPDRLVLIYHNITPAHWFYGISPHMTELAVQGLEQLKQLRDRTEVVWADSQYNADFMVDLHYSRVQVLPIIFDFDRFNLPPNPVFRRQYHSPQTTWLFVGRVTPNKCHEDIIKAFAVYKEHLDPRSRLIFVGDVQNCWRYSNAMIQLVRDLGVPDVHFTGMIDDDELVAMFQMADVFICMSEHEGFCVPLLEAMHFSVPVLAYRAGAVPGTMGGAGILTGTKDPVKIAELAYSVIHDKRLREGVLYAQNDRLQKIKNLNYTQLVRELVRELE